MEKQNYRQGDQNMSEEQHDDSRAINEEDFKILHSYVFSDEDIWDIAGFTSFYNLSNRMMNLLAVRLDEEFYSLGR